MIAKAKGQVEVLTSEVHVHGGYYCSYVRTVILKFHQPASTLESRNREIKSWRRHHTNQAPEENTNGQQLVKYLLQHKQRCYYKLIIVKTCISLCQFDPYPTQA